MSKKIKHIRLWGCFSRSTGNPLFLVINPLKARTSFLWSRNNWCLSITKNRSSQLWTETIERHFICPLYKYKNKFLKESQYCNETNPWMLLSTPGSGCQPTYLGTEVIRRVPKLHTLGLWMRNKDTITIRLLLLLSFLLFIISLMKWEGAWSLSRHPNNFISSTHDVILLESDKLLVYRMMQKGARGLVFLTR